MDQESRRAPRLLAVAALTALFAGSLVTTSATAVHAATPPRVFSELSFTQEPNVWTDSACRAEPGTGVTPAEVRLGDNASASTSASRTDTFVPVAAVTDSTTANISQRATARAVTRNGLPSLVQIDFAGQAKAAASKTPASCAVAGQIRGNLGFTFTVTRPLWATLSYTKTGANYAEAYIYSSGTGRAYEDLYGRLFKGSGSTTVLLPPGEYSGYVQGQTVLSSTSTSTSMNASGSVRIAFAETGSASAAASGAAKSYVSFGAARSCSAHKLSTRLTTSAKRIKAVSKVSFAVNGKTVKTLKGRQVKRGITVGLPIRDDVAASVRVTVKLKNGKTRTAAASYRACA